jgi:DNA-nicking Smr family endonuclease
VKKSADTEDLRLWSVITATVRPLKPARPRPSLPLVGRVDREAGRVGPSEASAKSAPGPKHPRPVDAAHRPARPMKRRELPPADVDAALHRRLTRGQDAIAARIDLHGMTQDEARAALTAFVARATAAGWRAVLVITGKGVSGDGVLRKRVPDWLAAAPIREHVAGVSEAHRRHGGEGALYVALKWRG